MEWKAPLYQALIKHQTLNRSSFHTPGHKNNDSVFPPDLLNLDFTELPDTDSLYEASGPILLAEKRAAELFGVKRSLISSGGCTLCIQAMLRLAAPCGGKIVVGRMLHRSAVHTMALLGLEPVWVFPRTDKGADLPGRIHPEDIEKALQMAEDVRAVYLTSPDYFGVISDVPAISKICKKYGVPLLVDNAHGSHLRFVFPNLHPAHLGASMTACSAHKTLPVLTGGALLNIAEEKYVEEAKEAMALFGSTSPSYPIMASLDLACAWLEQKGEKAYQTLQQRISYLKEEANRCGIAIPQGETDPIRLSLHTASVGISGIQAAEHFRNCGVEPEYADGAFVVFLSTPFNSEKDFERLEHGIRTLPQGNALKISHSLPIPPEISCSLREAVLAPQEWVSLENAVGRIAGQAACPCPPGIPVVMPGEKIGSQAVEFLQKYGFLQVKVLK